MFHILSKNEVTDMTVDELMDLDRAFFESVSKQGATAWGNQFADTGIMLVKQGENIVGEAHVYEAMKPFFAQKGSTLSWLPEDGGISEAGDLGYTYGKYIRQYRTEAGANTKETGRYMTIWRKQANGSYKIEVDMGI